MSGKWIEMRNNQYFITVPQSHTILGEENRTLFTNIPMTHGLLMIQSPEAGKVSKTLFVSSTKSVWCSYIDGYYDRNPIQSRLMRWDGEWVRADHTLSDTSARVVALLRLSDYGSVVQYLVPISFIIYHLFSVWGERVFCVLGGSVRYWTGDSGGPAGAGDGWQTQSIKGGLYYYKLLFKCLFWYDPT